MHARYSDLPLDSLTTSARQGSSEGSCPSSAIPYEPPDFRLTFCTIQLIHSTEMEQISESAQTAVSSSQARELNALNEGLQYKLEKLALESEFDELCNARLAGEKKGADKDQ